MWSSSRRNRWRQIWCASAISQFCAERGLRLNFIGAGYRDHDEFLDRAEAVARRVPIADRTVKTITIAGNDYTPQKEKEGASLALQGVERYCCAQAQGVEAVGGFAEFAIGEREAHMGRRVIGI